MSVSQKSRCHAIIHSASASAAVIGGGLAQVPCSDNAIITPIQLTMIIALGKVFGIDLSDASAKAALASAAAATVGRAASQVLVGWIPGIGNVINAGTAASVTEGIGWVIASEFHKNATAQRFSYAGGR